MALLIILDGALGASIIKTYKSIQETFSKSLKEICGNPHSM